jgi:hypothetical protein
MSFLFLSSYSQYLISYFSSSCSLYFVYFIFSPLFSTFLMFSVIRFQHIHCQKRVLSLRSALTVSANTASLLLYLRFGSASSAVTCSRWFFARGFFYPEDGGDTILRNVGSIDHIYTAPHPRRRHSS